MWWIVWCASVAAIAWVYRQSAGPHQRALRCGLITAYYACAFCWFLFVWSAVPWAQEAVQCALARGGEPMWTATQVYFGVQLGFYCAGLWDLARQRPQHRARDWPVMIAHHAITLFLIGACLAFSSHWIGLYVLGLHDAGDVFLYASDTMHKLKLKSRRLNVAKTACFTLFAAVFAYTRLYLFGWRLVLGTCWAQAVRLWPSPGHALMWLGLAALGAMHCYWAALIVQMAHRLAFISVNSEDVRE